MVLNVKRARKVMEERGLAALIAAQPSNVTYAADFTGLLHYELMEQIYVVLVASEISNPTIVLPVGEARDLVSDRRAGLATVRSMKPYGTYIINRRRGERLDATELETDRMIREKKHAGPLEALVEALNERGLDGARIGLDDEVVPVVGYDALAKRVEHAVRAASVVKGSEAFTEIRAVKTPEEVERLSKAATATEAAFEKAVDAAKPGATGRELMDILMNETIRTGCLFKSQVYPTLAFGRKSYLQNVVHTARERLKKGDLIRFDGGGSFRFYSSDIARNAVLGRASAEQRRYYDAVFAGEQAIIDHARPGVTASELYRMSMETMRGRIPGFMRAHCGHTIGIETYDGVMISPTDDTVIEEGMVLNPETPYDEFGLGKFHVEDPILVTSRGARLLTKGHRELCEV